MYTYVECSPALQKLQHQKLNVDEDAIRKHKFVNILDDPGSADLSTYVDFASIRHSAEEVSGEVSVHGPITQSQFLGALGINFRVEALTQNCTEEQFESLRNGYWQLVGEGEAPFWEGPDDKVPIGMGTRYLAMAIVNKETRCSTERDQRERERVKREWGRFCQTTWRTAVGRLSRVIGGVSGDVVSLIRQMAASLQFPQGIFPAGTC
ncbi:hypothetical protein GBA52_025478 [Prunus armeniaca]|nr:hypothetical protein GBA52_025478 [Prunus armeniaca]